MTPRFPFCRTKQGIKEEAQIGKTYISDCLTMRCLCGNGFERSHRPKIWKGRQIYQQIVVVKTQKWTRLPRKRIQHENKRELRAELCRKRIQKRDGDETIRKLEEERGRTRKVSYESQGRREFQEGNSDHYHKADREGGLQKRCSYE